MRVLSDEVLEKGTPGLVNDEEKLCESCNEDISLECYNFGIKKIGRMEASQ